MSTKIPAVLVTAFLLAGTASATSPAQTELTFPSGDWLGDLGAQSLVVRSLYGRLAAYTAGSGERLKLEIDDVRALDPSELDRALWLDVVSMPGGEMIDMLRSMHQDDYHGAATVTYRPSWSVSEETWKLSEEGSKLIGMSIADVLREASRQQPQLAGVEGVTTYEVTVRMEGRSRSYRAALLWYPSASGTERRFLVADNITQGVEEAAGESLSVGGFGEQPGKIEPFRNSLEKCTCQSWSDTIKRTFGAEDTSGHLTGQHHGYASFKAVCACSRSCASTCEASVSWQSCDDHGIKNMCHKMASSVSGSSNRVDKGRSQGAACAAGFGCVEKACLFCLCDLKIGVSIAGTGVSFNVSGSTPDWSGNQQFSRTCAPCTP